MYKIFIVEDDAAIAGAIDTHLRSWGYECSVAEHFQDIYAEFVSVNPQLVLMDVSLPFRNGYHWCSEIRKVSNCPILFISSSADNMSIVTAINMGADDFIAKPFDLSVLVAKVRASMRRAYDFTASADVMEAGGVTLRLSDGAALSGGQAASLTRNEQRVLEVLFLNKGKIVSREQLMQRLWETDMFVDENTLTVNMTRLRKKLATIGAEDLIVTKKGLGYMVEK